MISKFIAIISKVPYAQSETERIKFEIFRLIAIWFATSISFAFLWLTVSVYSSASIESDATFFMRLTWASAGVCYFLIWFLAGTKYYRSSIWFFAFIMGALTNNLYAQVGTDEVLYRQLIYVFLTVLILSVYLKKTHLYLIALTFYLSFVLNMYLTSHFRIGVFLAMSVASTFAIAAIELVTRLRAAEAEIREKERARALHSSRLSTLGETTAFLVHEVSSPLTILAGHLELLEKRENFDYHIGKMKNAVERAIDFITSVKRMVRANHPNEYEVIRLSEILKMVSDLIEPGLRRKGIRLEFDYAEDIELSCRPAEIAQVIINLINNSADAVSSMTDRWIRVSCKSAGQSFDIEVSDPGQGIDLAYAGKVMDPFFTTKSTGSGIGLTVAQQVATHHDGRVDIISLKNPTAVRLRIALTPAFVRSGNRSLNSPNFPRYNPDLGL